MRCIRLILEISAGLSAVCAARKSRDINHIFCYHKVRSFGTAVICYSLVIERFGNIDHDIIIAGIFGRINFDIRRFLGIERFVIIGDLCFTSAETCGDFYIFRIELFTVSKAVERA